MNFWAKILLYAAAALFTGVLGKYVADMVYFEERADLIE